MKAIMAEGRQSFPNGSRAKIDGLDSCALYLYYELLNSYTIDQKWLETVQKKRHRVPAEQNKDLHGLEDLPKPTET